MFQPGAQGGGDESPGPRSGELELHLPFDLYPVALSSEEGTDHGTARPLFRREAEPRSDPAHQRHRGNEALPKKRPHRRSSPTVDLPADHATIAPHDGTLVGQPARQAGAITDERDAAALDAGEPTLTARTGIPAWRRRSAKPTITLRSASGTWAASRRLVVR